MGCRRQGRIEHGRHRGKGRGSKSLKKIWRLARGLCGGKAGIEGRVWEMRFLVG